MKLGDSNWCFKLWGLCCCRFHPLLGQSKFIQSNHPPQLYFTIRGLAPWGLENETKNEVWAQNFIFLERPPTSPSEWTTRKSWQVIGLFAKNTTQKLQKFNITSAAAVIHAAGKHNTISTSTLTSPVILSGTPHNHDTAYQYRAITLHAWIKM